MTDDLAGRPRHPRWQHSLAFLAQVCARLGDTHRAALLWYAGRCLMYGTVFCYGAAGRYLGLAAATMGRWDAAARHFEEGLARNAQMGARPQLARTQHDYAAMLLSRGRRTRTERSIC